MDRIDSILFLSSQFPTFGLSLGKVLSQNSHIMFTPSALSFISPIETASDPSLSAPGDPDEKDPCWLSVQWFTRWSQLPAPAQKALPAGPPPPLPRELVLDARPFNPEVLISTVWDKCEVRTEGNECWGRNCGPCVSDTVDSGC